MKTEARAIINIGEKGLVTVTLLVNPSQLKELKQNVSDGDIFVDVVKDDNFTDGTTNEVKLE
jgi:hypothetical protein|tara:strand:- start:2630 stop:2815 length:186 start_codon:yes stop_codon:yes gene_type:complete